jgi:hypothetical protein
MKTRLTLWAALLLGTASCQSSGEAPTPARPVTVEYRLTSATATEASRVEYTNETGGQTILEDVALPFTATITLAPGKSANLNAALKEAPGQDQQLRGQLLVDQKVVKDETARGSLPIVMLLVVNQ